MSSVTRWRERISTSGPCKQPDLPARGTISAASLITTTRRPGSQVRFKRRHVISATPASVTAICEGNMKTLLSVDGGGIRGIIPLACLVRLESHLGGYCNEVFDMIGGTSTGAIIAAGLALGVSARGLLALYRRFAEQAFKHLPWWQVLWTLGNHRYSNEFVAAMLDEIGADRPINTLPIDLVITAKNTQTGRTDFFVRDHPSNAQQWGTMSLKDAVLASIAAPTYFPAHTAAVLGKDHTWVDGGVGVAGNPCYQVAVEALHYSGGEYHEGDTRLYAFGTGRAPHQIDPQRANLLQWGLWTLDEVLDDAAEWQSYVTKLEYDVPNRLAFRRYQIDLAEDVMQTLGVEIPAGRDIGNVGMDAVWAVDLLDRIGRAFADRIDFDSPSGFHLQTQLGW
jgi:Patatin-like phospholipase